MLLPDRPPSYPGKTAELTHTFDSAGTLEIGCHQPGHYSAGMKIGVSVA